MKQIVKIYNELNVEGTYDEVYVEGFTQKQIYYQIEEICNKVLAEAEVYLNSLELKVDTPVNVKAERAVDDTVSTTSYSKETAKECEKESSSKSEDEESLIEPSEEDVQTKMESSDEGPVYIENVGTDYSDGSSVDEDTYSDDGEDLNVEEIKNRPASDLLNLLDKNIKK